MSEYVSLTSRKIRGTATWRLSIYVQCGVAKKAGSSFIRQD